eukprot:scaffold106732_cov34-Tisochrysis_lutea.AAC.3
MGSGAFCLLRWARRESIIILISVAFCVHKSQVTRWYQMEIKDPPTSLSADVPGSRASSYDK